ncbi:GntR family transcriptional regulator, partial [Streptomyces somaliensis DSM 40738]|nr:GntR family transcriptional regulator [Streptomyces somaliensis DSM 40738]
AAYARDAHRLGLSLDEARSAVADALRTVYGR